VSKIERELSEITGKYVAAKKELMVYGALETQRKEIQRNIDYMTKLETENGHLKKECAHLRENARDVTVLEERALSLSEKAKSLGVYREKVVQLESECSELNEKLGVWKSHNLGPQDALQEIERLKLTIKRKEEALEESGIRCRDLELQQQEGQLLLEDTKRRQDKLNSQYLEEIRLRRLAELARDALSDEVKELKTQVDQWANDLAEKNVETLKGTPVIPPTQDQVSEILQLKQHNDQLRNKLEELSKFSTAEKSPSGDPSSANSNNAAIHELVRFKMTVENLFGYRLPSMSTTELVLWPQFATDPNHTFTFSRDEAGRVMFRAMGCEEFKMQQTKRLEKWGQKGSIPGFLCDVTLSYLENS
jgi:ubiquinone biosynthesis protein UbiJ